jgi:hypothetical protein
MNTRVRLGLWFGCLALAVAAFSLFLGVPLGMDVILRITLVFLLPAWLLCIPMIVGFKDAEKARIWIIILSGAVTGPLVLMARCLQLRGGDAYAIWHGDPVAPGTSVFMAFAAIVGLVLTAIYGISLKILHRRFAA